MIVCCGLSLALAAPVRDRDLDAWQQAADALANHDLSSAMATLDALAQAGGLLAPGAALALGITCARWELYFPCPVGPGAIEQLAALAGRQPRGPLQQHALSWLATMALRSSDPALPEERLRETAARFGLDLPALWLLLDDAQIRFSTIWTRDALAAVATDPLWLRHDALPELVLRLRDDRHAIKGAAVEERTIRALEDRLKIGGPWWETPRPEPYATIALTIASDRALDEFVALQADGREQEALACARQWLAVSPAEAPRTWAQFALGDDRTVVQGPDEGYRAFAAYRLLAALGETPGLYLEDPTLEALRPRERARSSTQRCSVGQRAGSSNTDARRPPSGGRAC